MTNFKKIALFATAAIFSAQAYAACCDDKEGLEVKLQGMFDFQAGIRQQNKLADKKLLSQTQKNGALYTNANVRALVSNTTDCGLTYGANVVLRTTASSNSAPSVNGSHLFMQNNYGKLELGAKDDVASTMTLSAYSIARATGDDWTRYVNLNPENLYNGNPSDYGFVTDNFKSQSGPFAGTERSRKVSYYTPKYSGLQIGVSYTPDSSNAGDSAFNGTGSTGIQSNVFYDKLNSYTKGNYDVVAKDIVSLGASYEHEIDDGVDIKVALTGEQGKAIARKHDNASPKNYTETTKIADLKSYTVGTVLNLGSWSVAGSYADLGKSLTSPKFNYDNKRTNMYSAGVAYVQGPMGVSLTYIHTERFKNKLNAYTLGTDYKMAPGLMPYAEVTVFDAKNRGYKSLNNTTLDSTKVNHQKRKGTVYLIGAKLSF